MPLRQLPYSEARKLMKPGDVIAYSGKADLSNFIKWVTRAGVSHLSVVVQAKLLYEHTETPAEGFLNQVMEATSSGVHFSRLSDHMRYYDGEIWWLPLRQDLRDKMNVQALYDFLLHQEHKGYDIAQAVRSGVDRFDSAIGGLSKNKEDFARFFCSELVAAALERAGIVPHWNSSEITPADLTRFSLFQDDYFQLKGEMKQLKGYNSLDPLGWGE